ncbi:hypothetical protein [Kushneria phosphatilytica]|uniref:Uncharacterized protein n=1 Tax=Kushneria phosphatilytica TaxID=657387 RepID=A0A1S1NTD4_9GAMM|nr:hypothetical protein [Kushneria phosphatilytica]OHV08679.1 hypothetical protein BH688_11630 [Kushneria phosphatilytica]QEL12397.1 hypothetical protein FY550_15455 [Kushneria phosphatilytica]
MTLLMIGGTAYALLMLFVVGAMMVSGRASDREELQRQTVQVPATSEAGQMKLKVAPQQHPHPQQHAA